MKDYEPTYEGQYDKCCDERAALEIELSARDARIAELERQIEIRNAECRAWRALDDTLRSESFTTLNDRRGDVDAARAATDAAGGVA
jgi:hypothetical protein